MRKYGIQFQCVYRLLHVQTFGVMELYAVQRPILECLRLFLYRYFDSVPAYAPLLDGALRMPSCRDAISSRATSHNLTCLQA